LRQLLWPVLLWRCGHWVVLGFCLVKTAQTINPTTLKQTQQLRNEIITRWPVLCYDSAKPEKRN
jgi:hypothetical protein